MKKTSEKKVPFFARYLEAQELAGSTGACRRSYTKKYPSDQEEDGGGPITTLKYPSDGEDGGNYVTLKYPSDGEDSGAES